MKDHIVSTIEESKRVLKKKRAHYLAAAQTEDVDEVGLMDSQVPTNAAEAIKESRSKIVKMSDTLRGIARGMLIYSIVCLALKLIDFSDLHKRLEDFTEN